MTGGAPFRVVTWNVRFADEEGPHPWSVRRPVLVRRLRELDPDVLALEEVLPEQLDDLCAALDGHADVGQGREGGSHGEHVPVFVRRARFRILAAYDRWLSDTPEVPGSTSWGNRLPRMFTSVRLAEEATGRELVVVNVHLDHLSARSRRRSAEALVAWIGELGEELPAVLAGDLNEPEGGPVDRILDDGGFVDAWDSAEVRGAWYGTYTGFGALDPRGPRIDRVMVRGALTVLRVDTPPPEAGEAVPSDHLPVVVDLRWR